MQVDVLVETPTGSRNKYELDPETGRIRLDRTLYASLRFPADYGFIEGTLSGDGDPLDALVMLDEPSFPGCLIACRPVGVLDMRDQNAEDYKILVVPARKGATNWRTLKDVPETLQQEIAHFFTVYKDLDADKWTEVCGWADLDEAERLVTEAQARYQEERETAPSRRR